MPTITIDGKPCSYDGKKMILQVALDNGVEIPHYCYHPGLSIVASCRICLAEIEQPNPRNEGKLELIPKLMPTCQTPASDGMVIHTKSPKTIANQKAVMEYLLINHPLDCPVCDQAGECHLQDYSYRYGRGESRFQEAKIKQPVKDVGPYVKLYSDRCIMCTRCVRFTKEVSGTSELGVFGRGSREQIDVFPGQSLDNELSGNVVDLCPVGALLDKDFLFTQRVWFLSKTASIDPLTAGGDNIWIEHNEGQIYRVKPRTCAEANKWWITDETRYGWKFVHSEDRLAQPRRQQLSDMIDCDWKRACAEATRGLRDAAGKGAGTIAVMVSPMLTCEEAYLLGKLARGLDSQAVLAVGPVPTRGEDKTFPGGYTICAEKCPNRRGVTRVLQGFGGEVIDCDALLAKLADKACPIAAVIVTGNYPANWVPDALPKALGKRFVVLIDTLKTALSDKATVVLPGATWAEKSGTFENHKNRLQAFNAAIPVHEGARPEGQILLDLLASAGLSSPAAFDAQAIRQQIGGALAGEVQLPKDDAEMGLDMQYVEL
ncbi:MAG: (2Fe-2S)-binding protein [Phycisphaeraceae bacterium]|nr:(2Fe-2S)-binding protein [Phycisphaeraceae bacterium]